MSETVICKSIALREYCDVGIPGFENFEIQEKPFPLKDFQHSLPENHMIIQILVISADPYLRFSLKSAKGGGTGAIHPGETLQGYVAGKVLHSNINHWKEGDLFGGLLPFRTYQVITEKQSNPEHMWKLTNLIEENNISLGVGILGMPGATAYAGIDLLQPHRDEILYINAASGAVGGLVGMIAKNVFQCQVIGSCGGDEKCQFIKDNFGFDFALDYKKYSKKTDLSQHISDITPEGIDMVFENVGGIQFEVAFENLRRHGRMVVCGWISGYNSESPPKVQIDGERILFNQLRIEGFLCWPWLHGKRGNFLSDMHNWLKEGKVKPHETIFEGIESWSEAFQSLFTGKHFGKVVIRVN